MQGDEVPTAATQLAAYDLVKERLGLVEEELGRALESDVPLVREIGGYLRRNGGKRLRPALVLLCSRLCGYRGDADVELGAIVEFIHTATLVHDDIIDGAAVRRGREAVNVVWGNRLAVLLGDYLYARSLSMSVALGDLRLVEVLTDATSRLVEGEILDVVHEGDLDLDTDTYLEIVERKTAALFAGCGRSAAILAGAPGEVERSLDGYGRNLGMAFQLVDDLLDYGADPEVLGKQTGTDLREGKVTLPLIDLLEGAPAAVRSRVDERLGDPECGRGEFLEIVDLMEQEGALEHTRSTARRYADAAREHLEVLPPSPVREALLQLPEFVLHRGH